MPGSENAPLKHWFRAAKSASVLTGHHPRFLPDGTHLVYVNGSGELALYDLEKGDGKVILSVKPDALQTPAVSPDGKWLYFARSTEGTAVWGAEL